MLVELNENQGKKLADNSGGESFLTFDVYLFATTIPDIDVNCNSCYKFSCPSAHNEA
jgi:hypothetical protein